MRHHSYTNKKINARGRRGQKVMKTHFEQMAGGVAAMRECDECSRRAEQGLQVLMTPMPALCCADAAKLDRQQKSENWDVIDAKFGSIKPHINPICNFDMKGVTRE